MGTQAERFCHPLVSPGKRGHSAGLFPSSSGTQSFIGEHAGKFLDGAILDNLIVEEPRLWEKIDRVVRELMACQEPEGYLGTYTPDMRWIGRATERKENNAWDVWGAKYCLLALL